MDILELLLLLFQNFQSLYLLSLLLLLCFCCASVVFLCVCVCLSVCVFLMHGQTTEPIFMKVCTGVLLHQGDVLVGFAMFACARARAHVHANVFSATLTATLLNRFS